MSSVLHSCEKRTVVCITFGFASEIRTLSSGGANPPTTKHVRWHQVDLPLIFSAPHSSAMCCTHATPNHLLTIALLTYRSHSQLNFSVIMYAGRNKNKKMQYQRQLSAQRRGARTPTSPSRKRSVLTSILLINVRMRWKKKDVLPKKINSYNCSFRNLSDIME